MRIYNVKPGKEPKRYGHQCAICAKWVPRKIPISEHNTAIPWNESRYKQAVEASLADSATRSVEKLAEMRREYALYLRSPVWAAIRQRVLARDKGRCRVFSHDHANAEEVHHLRYPDRNDGLGSEPLEWLISVCRSCHIRLHEAQKWG